MPRARNGNRSRRRTLHAHSRGLPPTRRGARGLRRPHHEPPYGCVSTRTFPRRSIDPRELLAEPDLGEDLPRAAASGECQPKLNLARLANVGADGLEGDLAGAAAVEVVLAGERDLGLPVARWLDVLHLDRRRRLRPSWRSACLVSSSGGAGGARPAGTCCVRGASAGGHDPVDAVVPDLVHRLHVVDRPDVDGVAVAVSTVTKSWGDDGDPLNEVGTWKTL